MDRNKCTQCGGNHPVSKCPKKEIDMAAPPGDIPPPAVSQLQVPQKKHTQTYPLIIQIHHIQWLQYHPIQKTQIYVLNVVSPVTWQ